VAKDGFVKSRHSRAGGNPESAKILKRLDSRFHGNDEIAHFQTFYETIKVNELAKSGKRWFRKKLSRYRRDKARNLAPSGADGLFTRPSIFEKK